MPKIHPVTSSATPGGDTSGREVELPTTSNSSNNPETKVGKPHHREDESPSSVATGPRHRHQVSSGGVHVRNGSDASVLASGGGGSSAAGSDSLDSSVDSTLGPQQRHRKTASMESAASADTSTGDGATSEGSEGVLTPRLNDLEMEKSIKRRNSAKLARTMTTFFEQKVSKMHSALALDPTGVVWQWWSLVVVLLLAYTIVVLPLEVPFDDVIGQLFWVDICVDLLFVADLCLLFFVG